MSDSNVVSSQQPAYFSSAGKFKGISASALKIIAVILMLIDHTSVAYNGGDVNVWRCIGRLAFPVFAFFIAQGALRTKHIGKYMLRLGVFALISEVPFDMVICGKWFSLTDQNVYFTLLLGLICVYVLKLLKEKHLDAWGILTTFGFCVIAVLLKTDYAGTGVLCITLFYLAITATGAKRVFIVIVGCFTLAFTWYNNTLCISPIEFLSIFATPLLLLYNGEKGVKINKYAFYAFYPAHLLILGLLRLFVFS